MNRTPNRQRDCILKLVVSCHIWLWGIGMISTSSAQENWPQFRGPDGQGHSSALHMPTQIDDARFLTWKTPIPGHGLSSPVIWGNQIWMTTALNDGRALHAVCVDKKSGKILHDLEIFTNEKPININVKNSHASPTAVIQEGRLFVHFGTYGTAAIDTRTGKKLWENRNLKLDHQEGPGSSPVLFEDLFIVNCDGRDVRYVVALDQANGSIRWKTERPGKPHPTGDVNKSFSTPTLVQINGKWQLISPGAKWVVAYNPANGEELWKVKYPVSGVYAGFSVAPRPVTAHGLAFVTTGYMKPELIAIRMNGVGDVSESHVEWKETAAVPANPSLIVADDLLYMISDSGVLTCLQAKTGKVVWKNRLNEKFWASPLLANGKLYFCGETGKIFVLKVGPKFEKLYEGKFPEEIQASLAVSGETLFLRTKGFLYRIEGRQEL